MKTATIIKRDLPGSRGEAHIYQLNPPYDGNEFAVISSVVVCYAALGGLVSHSEPEVLAFPSDGARVTSWDALDGIAGTLSHSKLLSQMGYEIRDHAETVASEEFLNEGPR